MLNNPDSKMLAIWCQIGSKLDQILITKAICVRIWLWICRQSLLTGYASRLVAETEQNRA